MHNYVYFKIVKKAFMVYFKNNKKCFIQTDSFLLAVVCSAIFILFLSSCSAKKNTWNSRAYHNVTGEFNVSFNARESFKEGVKKAEEYMPQDFNELLPVFTFAHDEITGHVTSEMDRVIAKSVKAIQKHSITVKPKQKSNPTKKERDFYNQREFTKVIDDAYLLQAKANTYLHQYVQAIQLLDFIIMEYPKGSAEKEAKIWLAVVLTQTEDLERAERLLTESAKDKELKKKERVLLNAAYANAGIYNKEYSQAALYLEQVLKKEKRKNNKVRYHFLLAQLYELSKENEKAIAHLDEIVKLRPNYDLLFAAQMRKASNASSGRNLQQLFLKMLKDDKNEDYIDQIYYALSKVEQAAGNDEGAINYLKQSIAANRGNDRQQGLSYARLGDYDYADKQYARAYTYYDSAAYFLGSRHRLYDSLQYKATTLKQLAENLYLIQREDSLQRIAKLPEEERNSLIVAQINKVLEAEQQEQQMQQDQQYYRIQQERDRYSNTGAQNQGVRWHFYDLNAVNYGATQFNMRWGKRPLEDNWRRRNKAIASEFSSTTVQETRDTTSLPETQYSNKTREYYIQHLPLTPEAMIASEERVCDALFKVGYAYWKDVHENELATSTFLTLLQRCANASSTQEASILYYLYELYTEEKQAGDAAFYKQRLIDKYPEEPLAQMLSNPNYLKEQEAQRATMSAMYEDLFQTYTAGQYAEADNKARQMMERYPNSFLQPQLAMIRALCAGRGNNIVAYKQALTAITNDYVNSEVAAKAAELLAEIALKELAYITDSDTALKDSAENIITAYVKQDSSTHYFAAICSKKINTNELLFKLESYNADTFRDKIFTVTIKEISANYVIVCVESFSNAVEVTNYYTNILQASVLPASSVDCRYVVISEENVDLLLNSEDIAAYIEFFRQQYQ